jgi:hypothetical protein
MTGSSAVSSAHLLYTPKNWETQMRLSCLLGRNSSDHVCAVGQGFFDMKCALDDMVKGMNVLFLS